MRDHIRFCVKTWFAGRSARRGGGTPRALWICLVTGAVCAVSGCGGGGSGGGDSLSAITFSSDRSVILPRSGGAYQLAATAGSGGAISWKSSDPRAVTVSPTGLVTAVAQTGSATITASSPGVASATASVIVAAPAPHTVLVDSADVVSAQGTQVTLKAKPATSAISVGDIVVSGDRAGVLGKVQSVSSAAGTITLQTGPASLVQAFPDLSIHLSGAPVAMTLQVSRGRAALIAPGGRTIAVTRDSSPFSCTDSGGATVNATLAGPSFSAPVTARLDATLDSRGFSAQDFSLSVNVSIPARIDTGSVTFTANGQTDFTCKAELPGFSLPGIPVGPVRIEATFGASAEIQVSANANAALTLHGPSITDTFSGNDGIAWSATAGWQSIARNSSTGLTLVPPGFDFTAQVHGKVSGFLRDDVGISATAADLNLVGANFVFDRVGGDLGFTINSPLSYTSTGYSGPTWGAGLELTAGPEIQLTGGVADLLKHLGVPVALATWNLYDQLVPLGASPTPALTASLAAVSQGGSETFTVVQPKSYAGSSVQFYAFPASGSPIRLGTAMVDSAGSAAMTWSPSAGQDGTYQVGAFLFGDAFGSAGFPYPSNRVTVKAGGGNVNATIH